MRDRESRPARSSRQAALRSAHSRYAQPHEGDWAGAAWRCGQSLLLLRPADPGEHSLREQGMVRRHVTSIHQGTGCRRRPRSLNRLAMLVLVALLVLSGPLAGVALAQGASANHVATGPHSHPSDVPQCHHDGTPHLPVGAVGSPSGKPNTSQADPPDRDGEAGAPAPLAPSSSLRAAYTRASVARRQPHGLASIYLLTRRFRL